MTSIICVLVYDIKKCIYRWNDTCYSVTVRLVWYLHLYLSCHFLSAFNTVPNLESESDTSSSDCTNESCEENTNTVNRFYNTSFTIIHHFSQRNETIMQREDIIFDHFSCDCFNLSIYILHIFPYFFAGQRAKYFSWQAEAFVITCDLLLLCTALTFSSTCCHLYHIDLSLVL